MSELTTIQILGWEKYNYRKDIAAPSWFRLAHDLFDDPQFYHFTNNEICFWIYLLCEASKKSSGTVLLNFLHAERIGRCKRSTILSALKKLEQIQVVSVDVTSTLRERDVGDTSACSTLHNKTEQNITHVGKFDFETLYKNYPRREGKTGGIKIAKREIKSPEDFEALSKAIDRYRKVKSGSEPQYILLFSTFMGSWRDWLDPDAGKVVVTKPQAQQVIQEKPEDEVPYADPERVRDLIAKSLYGKRDAS